MSQSILQIILFSVASAALAGIAGYVIAALIGKRRIDELVAVNRNRVEELEAEVDALGDRSTKARSRAEKLEAALKKSKATLTESQAKLKRAVERVQTMDKNIRTLRTERENTKIKINTLQSSLESVRRQTLALQAEFEKAGQFYKRELSKSFLLRKELEEEVKEARAEQVEFQKRVKESSLEHGSEQEMVVAAQLRLGQIDVLERNLAKLEAENDRLREEAKQRNRDKKELQKKLDELEELKINNKQLLRAVESLEKSRRKHEMDAEQSEQMSETLRMKLNDLEQSFASMEKEQQQAIKDVRSTVDGTSAANESGTDQIVEFSNYKSRK